MRPTPARFRYIGQPMKRVEDPRLLTGRGAFIDDLRFPDLLHVAILRSPHAHARLRGIDASRALAAPGVVAVFTAADLQGLHTFPVGEREYRPVTPFHPVLARDRVRFVGEPVAALVAESVFQARDALDLIEVAYEPLPAVTSAEQALRPDAPQLHDDAPGNLCLRFAETVGDVAGAFERAAHVLRVRIQTNRVAPVPMEPPGAVVEYDPGHDAFTLWVANQAPNRLRSGLSDILGIPETRIRVIAPEVGGGFGGKAMVGREHPLLCVIARALRRRVKWLATRSEEILLTNHGRGLLHEAEAAADADGNLLALRVRLYHTPGAYVSGPGLLPAVRSSQFSCGPYRVPAIEREILCAFTNTGPVGPNRGTGRPESIAMIERIMDEVARETGLDPLEVRQRNLLQPDQFPYHAPTHVTYDSGNYQQTLARALELADYAGLRRRQREARARGELLGIGLVTNIGMTGTPMWQSARVEVAQSGQVFVYTGTSPHGQGHETVWAQVAADFLGVPFEDITVVHGDTAVCPPGTGTFGTSGAPLGAPAVALASLRVREKLLRLAAHRLEVRPEDLTIEDGRVHVLGAPERAVTVKELARVAYTGRGLPPDEEPGLDATARFLQQSNPFAFGAFVAVTRVDPETGTVTVETIVGVDDCGTVLNPLILDGQTEGGVAWGMGQMLCEQIVYDEAGQPLTVTFMDYALPRADDMPRMLLDRTVTPSPLNPLGTKGGAEGSNIAVPAALYNSVLDALAPLGVRSIAMPLTAHNVWQAIQASRRAAERARPAAASR